MALETPTVGMSNEGMYARPFENGSEAIAKSAEAVGQNLAGEIDQLSAQILQLQIKAEKERAEAEALSLSNRAYEDLHKNQLEYSQLKNKDAIDNYDSYKQNISKIIEKYTPTDKAQPLTQKLFKEKAMQLQTRSNATLMAYQMEQIASWKMSELNSALNNTLNESLSNYGKPLFEENKRKALEQYDYIADAQGIDRNSETYKLGQLQTTSGLHFNGIMNEINREQLGNAWKHLQQYKDELTAEDYNKLLFDYKGAVARQQVGRGKKDLTEQEIMEMFETIFDNDPSLHHDFVEKNEEYMADDGTIKYRTKKVYISPKKGTFDYDRIKNAWVVKQSNIYKEEQEAIKSINGRAYLTAKQTYEKLKKDGEVLPTSAKALAQKSGLVNPTEEQLNLIQKMLSRENLGVGTFGDPIAYNKILTDIINGNIYKHYRDADAFQNFVRQYGLNEQQYNNVVMQYNKTQQSEYRSKVNDALDMLKSHFEVAKKLNTSKPKDKFISALLEKRAREDLVQLINRSDMPPDRAMNIIIARHGQVYNNLISNGEKSFDKFTNFINDLPNLTERERQEALLYANDLETKGASDRQIRASLANGDWRYVYEPLALGY